jgi:hypothetical protein
MLESEACEKWCPAVQVIVAKNGDIITNRMDHEYSTSECIGSNCMAWVEEGVRMTDEGMCPSGRCGWVKQ